MAFPALPGLSRGRQGEEAAEETGSPTLALPGSRPSPSFPLQLFSRGPQSRRSKTASSTGDTGPSVRQLVWFGFSDGHGARYRRGIPVGAGAGGAVNACAAQPRADTCPVAQTRVLWLVRRSQASATSSAGGMLFLVRLEGMHRRARGQEEGEGLGTSHPGTDTSQSRALLCRSGAPRAGGHLQSRPGPQPGRRCHPSCFCFSAGRCLGSSGVRMRT